MKTASIISLLIALGSLLVSIFVYFQSRKQFELANKTFVYVEETLKEDKLMVSLQNIIGSDVLLIDQIRIADKDLFREPDHENFEFSGYEELKDRPVGPGESINLLAISLKNPQNLENLPDELPLMIQYHDRSNNTQSKNKMVNLFNLKNALENKNIKREISSIKYDFRIMLERNQNIQVPDHIRERITDYNMVMPRQNLNTQ